MEEVKRNVRVLYCIKCHRRAKKQEGMFSFFYTCKIHQTNTQFVEKGIQGLTKGTGSLTSHLHRERYHVSDKPYNFLKV